MVMRSAPFTRQFWLTGLICGLCVAVPTLASAQSLDAVQERMEAGEAAMESAAAAADQQSGEAPTSLMEQAPPPSMEQAPIAEQAPVADAEPVPAADETAAVAPAETAPPVEPQMAEAEAAAPPTTYTVQPGDSLWSISSGYLTDPFFWPRLWDVNPTVQNPDLIFPGNVLSLPGAPVEELAEAPPAEEAPVEMTEAELLEEPAPEEAPAEPEAPMTAEELGERKPPSFEVLPQPPSQSKEILAFSSGYIAKGLPVSGIVVGSREHRVLLGEHDQIFLQSKGEELEAGARYTVYRRLKQVVHPATRRVLGDLIQVLGEVQVQQADSVSTAIITKSYTPIEPGDPIMPSHAIEGGPTSPIVEQTGEAVTGMVVEVIDQKQLNAQFDVVYIDQGEAAGVVTGDRFQIYRRGERTPAYASVPNVRLPDRLIGEAEVLNVQAGTATALLVHSVDTVKPGDRIER